MTPRHYMTAEGSATVVFPFLKIEGSLTPVVKKLEREVRPGVDGIGIWLMGSRGEPFQISTSLDCTSLSALNAAFLTYVAAVGTKKDLYYATALWGTVLVHDVKMNPVRPIASGVGGINDFAGGSGVVLDVQWTVETLV